MCEVIYSITIPQKIRFYSKNNREDLNRSAQIAFEIFSLLSEQSNDKELLLRVREICHDDTYTHIRLSSGTTQYECEVIISRFQDIYTLMEPHLKVKWYKDPPVILERVLHTIEQ